MTNEKNSSQNTTTEYPCCAFCKTKIEQTQYEADKKCAHCGGYGFFLGVDHLRLIKWYVLSSGIQFSRLEDVYLPNYRHEKITLENILNTLEIRNKGIEWRAERAKEDATLNGFMTGMLVGLFTVFAVALLFFWQFGFKIS